ncbi:hypothetical protein BHE97_17290 [Aeromicrobium sp. PE09-221]|uniref:hypothetical protein n=1 Tax=Aeromicrobium sp. PE09-221 TaxID=1898043 RepID=UPI000B3E7063|nr:hypothetical protein [Aeromicrobium sp. PE09-221]OUZ07259.1 hypothetical protein BHE97_17290 [Aeromicrobium sp. PE09-221]
MKQYSLRHDGRTLTVEFDGGSLFWYRVRLIVDGDVVDERSLLVGTTRLRAGRPTSLAVDATVGFWGPKGAVLISAGELDVNRPFTRDPES